MSTITPTEYASSVILATPLLSKTWQSFFNVDSAIKSVQDHVMQLPSSQTSEKHTMRVYSDGLKYFLNWYANELPTEALMNSFIAHLVERGLKPSTIGSKYLAPVRLFLKKLANQHIPVFGDERDLVTDAKESIRQASEVKTPRAQTTSNIAPLWRGDFVRLSHGQVNSVLRKIDTDTITGSRDYALLLLAFSSALRLAELHRLSLSNISQEGDVYIITVRGKRSNVDPVPVGASVVQAIMKYVANFNAKLSPDDKRRIGQTTPLWQPMIHGDNHPIIGVNGYKAGNGMSQQAMRDIIANRTAILGESYKLAAHDTRRTAAALAYENGMNLPEIQQLLRHKDAGVTLRYIGTKPEYGARTLANYVALG